MPGNTHLYLQASSQNVWQNAYVRNASRAHLTDYAGEGWRDWSYVSFITNNANQIMINVFSTLDIVLQEVENSASQANSAQLIILAVVGIVCCTLVTSFVYWINSQVSLPAVLLQNVLLFSHVRCR